MARARDGRTADERLEILNDREGVWRCRTIFNSTAACPREIRITKAIGEVKKAIPQRLRPRRTHPPRGYVPRLTGGGGWMAG